jgi:hypothetical protein
MPCYLLRPLSLLQADLTSVGLNKSSFRKSKDSEPAPVASTAAENGRASTGIGWSAREARSNIIVTATPLTPSYHARTLTRRLNSGGEDWANVTRVQGDSIQTRSSTVEALSSCTSGSEQATRTETKHDIELN